MHRTRRSFVKGGALALVAMGAAPGFVVPGIAPGVLALGTPLLAAGPPGP